MIPPNRRVYVRSIVNFAVGSALIVNLIGCGGNPDQRKSGTLATPIDFVEKAGEAAGKAEDAAKNISKKK
ncbi:hypothetical protein GC170_10035 [bacterium]|nr:hypothetical protein [bacterium]